MKSVVSLFSRRTSVSPSAMYALSHMDRRLIADIGAEAIVRQHRDPLAVIAGLR